MLKLLSTFLEIVFIPERLFMDRMLGHIFSNDWPYVYEKCIKKRLKKNSKNISEILPACLSLLVKLRGKKTANKPVLL